MTLFFWASFAVVVYAYFGYAVLLAVLARLRPWPVARSPIFPTLSIVIAARNEARNLPAKLENLRRMDYPPELVQIVIASDGSTDESVNILRTAGPNVVPVVLESSRGKASALNAAVQHATGQVLVFLDARQSVDASAVKEMVSCFADAEVGAVSGELLLESGPGKSGNNALGLYWKIEKLVRKLESATGSVVGVTGAFYAIRRELYVAIPAGTLLDDVWVPMQVARQGKRVIFEPLAIARDQLFSEKGKEFSRKVRTLTGNYQLLQLAPWMITAANPLLFRFVSHKLLRLMVPMLLVVMVLSAALAHSPLYWVIFGMQVVFYLLALLGEGMPSAKSLKPVAIANTFVMLNAAAAMAFYNFVSGRKKLWS
jgi:biofilm PGA synthesis N-glycosyltransferase PgaC